jgi:hypothetical protein
MEENILGVTKLVNLLLGKPALALLAVLHITPSNPEYPIPNHDCDGVGGFPLLHRVLSVAARATCRWTIPARRNSAWKRCCTTR